MITEGDEPAQPKQSTSSGNRGGRGRGSRKRLVEDNDEEKE